MPERNKAVDRLIKGLHPNENLWYNNADYTMHIGDRTLDPDERTAFWDLHESAYDKMVQGIDWNRVLCEALSYHMARQELDSAHKTPFKDYSDDICGRLRDAGPPG